MDKELRDKASRLLKKSYDDQDKADDEVVTEKDLQFVVAYFSGYRESIRELFPDIEDDEQPNKA